MPIALRYLALLVPALGGCVTYTSADLSRMSTHDICALQVNQGLNLTDRSRELMLGELARRKENCAAHMRRIHAERDELLYDLTYRNQSP